MCQDYAGNSKFNRELRSWMTGRSFDKQALEIGILNWMPCGVSDQCQPILINVILTTVA